MISLSLLALGCVTFLVVVTVAAMLGIVSGKRGEPLGCIASCGTVIAMLIAGIIGVAIVVAFASRSRHHDWHVRGPDPRIERRVERLGHRIERLGEHIEDHADSFGDRAERFGERMEGAGERFEEGFERLGARIERRWDRSWDF